MRDPLLNCMALGGSDTRIIQLDPDRIQVEEFEAAAILADIIWGPEGFAECLGPTWKMVHDPRFMKIEREAIIYKRSMSGSTVAQGTALIQALDLRSKIEVVDDLVIFSELLGEGRVFLKAAQEKGWDPHTITPDQAQTLISMLCPNYQRRDGSWNDDAQRLRRMLAAGLIGLIADYAEVAYSQDWIRMDNQQLVPQGSRCDEEVTDMDVPTVAVEVDTLQRALTMRAQVRLTALRCLKQFPGIKQDELESVRLTDEEADQLCQILFKAESMDKLYTVLPEVLNLVKRAQAIPYEQRETEGCTKASSESKAFVAKLQSGEISPIIGDLMETEDPIYDVAAFVANLMGNEQQRARFEAIQMFEADGNPEAIGIVKRLLESNGSQDSWDEVYNFLVKAREEMLVERTKAQLDTAITTPETNEAVEPIERTVTIVDGEE